MASAYSPAQLAQWEEYVGLPQKYRASSKPELNAEYLEALHLHQIARVPYENLDLHYTTHRSISLDPQFHFQKIVGNARGRGGYCMEGNLLYNHILKAAGFNVYTAGVRIRMRIDGVPGGDYIGWVHVVNIVTFPSGEKYVSDVAFGGDGPTRPLPLIDGHSQVNLGSQEVRLVSSNLPNQRLQTPKYWFYQYRNKPEDEWNSFYAFPEIEFFDNDFIGMNWYTSTFVGGSNFQTTRVLIVQFIKGRVEGEENERVTGKRMLVDGVVKRNDGGRTEVVQVCHNEVERVRAIEQEFGMKLLPEEIQAIEGWKTELIDSDTRVQLA